MTDRRRTDTRSRVRNTALELFAAQGYEATGLAQVADRLGITRPAVYHHFRSKEELLTGAYDELRPVLRELTATRLAAEDTEGRAALLHRVAALVNGELGLMLTCAFVNENALRGIPQAAVMLADLDELAICLGGDTLAGRMRGRLALSALVQAHARDRKLGGTLTERRRIAGAIAADLIEVPRG